MVIRRRTLVAALIVPVLVGIVRGGDELVRFLLLGSLEAGSGISPTMGEWWLWTSVAILYFVPMFGATGAGIIGGRVAVPWVALAAAAAYFATSGFDWLIGVVAGTMAGFWAWVAATLYEVARDRRRRRGKTVNPS